MCRLTYQYQCKIYFVISVYNSKLINKYICNDTLAMMKFQFNIFKIIQIFYDQLLLVC